MSADISARDQSKRDDGSIASLRAVHVDGFGVLFAGNRVCLSLSRNHCAAAEDQIGTEQQHRTTRHRVQFPTQELVSVHCFQNSNLSGAKWDRNFSTESVSGLQMAWTLPQSHQLQDHDQAGLQDGIQAGDSTGVEMLPRVCGGRVSRGVFELHQLH